MHKHKHTHAHGRYEEYIPGVIGFANELQRFVVKQVLN
jgi:hypothetical protein